MRAIAKRIRDAAVLLLPVALLAAVPASAVGRTFSFTPGEAGIGRYASSANLLPNGKVLIVGGSVYNVSVETKTAELFDPASGKFEPLAAEALSAREEGASVTLPGGKILYVGGYSTAGGKGHPLGTLELFDPALGKFETVAAALSVPRDGPCAVLLPNGKVLIGCGENGYPNFVTGFETYDPATGKVEPAPGKALVGRYQPAISMLPNGKVLIAGGYTLEGKVNVYLKSAEIYDPATGAAELLGAGHELAVGRDEIAHVTLANGVPLLIGGWNETAFAQKTVEAFNPVTEVFEPAGELIEPRASGDAVLLADGRVFVVDGLNNKEEEAHYTKTAELGSVSRPGASAAPAASVTASSAVLEGSVLSEAFSTTYFQFGPTTAYGSRTPAASTAAGLAPVAVTAAVTGLAPGTTYHYALVAENIGGASTSTDQMFATPLGMPVFASVSQAHRRWREGAKLASISAKRTPVGTTFSFSLNEPATVKLEFTKPAPGRRNGKRCVAQTKRNAGRRPCKRAATVGTLSLAGHAGSDKVAFQGRLSKHRRLKPGTYTLVLSATAAGMHSKPARLTFTIVG